MAWKLAMAGALTAAAVLTMGADPVACAALAAGAPSSVLAGPRHQQHAGARTDAQDLLAHVRTGFVAEHQIDDRDVRLIAPREQHRLFAVACPQAAAHPGLT